MDPRVSTLETDVAAVRANVEAIHASYATNDALKSLETRVLLAVESAKNESNLGLTRVRDELDRKIDAVASTLDWKFDAVAGARDRKTDAVASAQDRKLDAVAGALERKFESAMAAQNTELHVALARQHANIKDDMFQLEKKMIAMNVELRMWFAGTTISIVAAVGGIAVALFNAIKH